MLTPCGVSQVDAWGWNPTTVGAIGTASAVIVAAVAVFFAYRAAKAERRLTERLVTIEEQRDQPRMVVLANLGGDFEPQGGHLHAIISVTNVGSIPGGPVSVSVCTDAGRDVSYIQSDPRYLAAAETVMFEVFLTAGVGSNEVFAFDDDRRGGSDLPERASGDGRWLPVKLRRGHHIRAWDAMTGRSSWYPAPPSREPPAPPLIV